MNKTKLVMYLLFATTRTGMLDLRKIIKPFYVAVVVVKKKKFMGRNSNYMNFSEWVSNDFMNPRTTMAAPHEILLL